ncbi:hypothetical protein V8E52_007657 [Russula decolorans]
MGDALTIALGDIALEELLLNKAMEVFVSKVDSKLIEGIGSGSEVLGSGKVKKANEVVGCTIWIKEDCATFLTSLVLYESAVSNANGVTAKNSEPGPKHPMNNGVDITSLVNGELEVAEMENGHY